MDILAIADDLTGALEAGAKFTAHGLTSVVSFHAAEAPVVVIDTETRHVSPELAERIVARAALPSVPLVYKKTDSTLRGNIGPELHALARAYDAARIAYVPAYPALGRTVRDGCLYVHGVPIHQTEFAGDARNPVRGSLIRELLHPDIACDVFDGVTDADVERAADWILSSGYRIVAGPAAIAEALARRSGQAVVPHFPAVTRCLLINGSRSAVSRGQIDIAMAQGLIGDTWRLLDSPKPFSRDAERHAAAIASATSAELERRQYDALMIFGGDTAYAIVQGLGVRRIQPIGEIVPGVPVSTAAGYTLITKAGGFGAPDVIAQVRAALRQGGKLCSA